MSLQTLREREVVASVLLEPDLADHPHFESLPEAAFLDLRLRLVIAAIRQLKEEQPVWCIQDLAERINLENTPAGTMPYVYGLSVDQRDGALSSSAFVKACEALQTTVQSTAAALPQDEAQDALQALHALTLALEDDDISANTRRSYCNDLSDFLWWLRRHHLDEQITLSFQLTALYLADCATERWFLTRRGKEPKLTRRQLKFGTVKRRLASLRYLARRLKTRAADGNQEPLVGFYNADEIGPSNHRLDRILKGIRRRLGVRSEGKRPFTLRQIQQMVQAVRRTDSTNFSSVRQNTLKLRNVALILWAYATGRRRSVLAAIQVEHLNFDDGDVGVEVQIPRSKGDQYGQGQSFYVTAIDSDFCPVAALRRLIGRRTRGPVFQRLDHRSKPSPFTGDHDAITGETVANVISAAAASIGLDPRNYGAHSMRHSMVRQATEKGISPARIRTTGGWGTIAGMDPYMRAAEIREASFTAALFS